VAVAAGPSGGAWLRDTPYHVRPRGLASDCGTQGSGSHRDWRPLPRAGRYWIWHLAVKSAGPQVRRTSPNAQGTSYINFFHPSHPYHFFSNHLTCLRDPATGQVQITMECKYALFFSARRTSHILHGPVGGSPASARSSMKRELFLISCMYEALAGGSDCTSPLPDVWSLLNSVDFNCGVAETSLPTPRPHSSHRAWYHHIHHTWVIIRCRNSL